MNKKNVTIIISVLVIIAGGFWIWKGNQKIVVSDQEKNQEQIQREEIDTSDWKTHRNDEFGFEFKLPNSFSEKTTKGRFTSPNPPREDTPKIEKEIWFEAGIGNGANIYYNRKLENTSKEELFNPLWREFVESGNVEVTTHKGETNDLEIVIVKAIFKDKPVVDGWIEGSYEHAAYFQCGDNICWISINSHTYSKDKERIFDSVISTLHLAK